MNNNNFSFKEGDWIATNDNEWRHVELIKSLKNGMCLFADGNGMSQLAVEEDYHLWRIEDAQDGDVIATPNDNIFIFKRINSNGQIWDYCGIYNGTFYPESGSPNGEITPECCKDYKPATLEQCNLLWQKMREKGYKWNSRTKEVVKAPFKLEGTLFSARDRGTIDEIIFALRTLGEEKMICYSEEIKFLEKIRKL